MIIFAGIVLSIIWSAITFLSKGIDPRLCNKISLLSGQWAHPFLTKMQNGFHYDVSNNQMPTEIFLALFTVAFLIYCAVIANVSAKKATKKSIISIFLFGIIFRLLLIPSIPIHENDFYRYIWDGKVSLSGINPYKYAPQDAEIMPGEKSSDKWQLKSLRDNNLTYFRRIGHRQVSTIYPPFAQLLFAASNFIKRDSISFMKLTFVLFDVLVVFLIYRLLLNFGMNPQMMVVYAWSPLVLKEIANSGHYDSVAVFIMVLSLLLLFGKRIWASTVCLSIGVLSKLFPLVTAPLLIRRTGIKYSAAFFVFIACAYLPVFFWGATGPARVFNGLATYARIWSKNAGVFEGLFLSLSMLSPAIIKDPFFVTKVILAITYCAILIFLVLGKTDSDFVFLKKTFWALAWLFLLSPVGDPWYFCWVMPFLCFFPYRAFIVLSWLLIFSYLSFSKSLGMVTLGPLEVPVLNVIQYVPFFILFLAEYLMQRKGRLAYVGQQKDLRINTGAQ